MTLWTYGGRLPAHPQDKATIMVTLGTTVDYTVLSIIHLTCEDGRYSTIHSTYCHYYQI